MILEQHRLREILDSLVFGYLIRCKYSGTLRAFLSESPHLSGTLHEAGIDLPPLPAISNDIDLLSANSEFELRRLISDRYKETFTLEDILQRFSCQCESGQNVQPFFFEFGDRLRQLLGDYMGKLNLFGRDQQTVYGARTQGKRIALLQKGSNDGPRTAFGGGASTSTTVTTQTNNGPPPSIVPPPPAHSQSSASSTSQRRVQPRRRQTTTKNNRSSFLLEPNIGANGGGGGPNANNNNENGVNHNASAVSSEATGGVLPQQRRKPREPHSTKERLLTGVEQLAQFVNTQVLTTTPPRGALPRRGGDYGSGGNGNGPSIRPPQQFHTFPESAFVPSIAVEGEELVIDGSSYSSPLSFAPSLSMDTSVANNESSFSNAVGTHFDQSHHQNNHAAVAVSTPRQLELLLDQPNIYDFLRDFDFDEEAEQRQMLLDDADCFGAGVGADFFDEDDGITAEFDGNRNYGANFFNGNIPEMNANANANNRSENAVGPHSSTPTISAGTIPAFSETPSSASNCPTGDENGVGKDGAIRSTTAFNTTSVGPSNVKVMEKKMQNSAAARVEGSAAAAVGATDVSPSSSATHNQFFSHNSRQLQPLSKETPVADKNRRHEEGDAPKKAAVEEELAEGEQDDEEENFEVIDEGRILVTPTKASKVVSLSSTKTPAPAPSPSPPRLISQRRISGFEPGTGKNAGGGGGVKRPMMAPRKDIAPKKKQRKREKTPQSPPPRQSSASICSPSPLFPSTPQKQAPSQNQSSTPSSSLSPSMLRTTSSLSSSVSHYQSPTKTTISSSSKKNGQPSPLISSPFEEEEEEESGGEESGEERNVVVVVVPCRRRQTQQMKKKHCGPMAPRKDIVSTKTKPKTKTPPATSSTVKARCAAVGKGKRTRRRTIESVCDDQNQIDDDDVGRDREKTALGENHHLFHPPLQQQQIPEEGIDHHNQEDLPADVDALFAVKTPIKNTNNATKGKTMANSKGTGRGRGKSVAPEKSANGENGEGNNGGGNSQLELSSLLLQNPALLERLLDTIHGPSP